MAVPMDFSSMKTINIANNLFVSLGSSRPRPTTDPKKKSLSLKGPKTEQHIPMPNTLVCIDYFDTIAYNCISKLRRIPKIEITNR